MGWLVQLIIGDHLSVIELVQLSEEVFSQLTVPFAYFDVVADLLEVDGGGGVVLVQTHAQGYLIINHSENGCLINLGNKGGTI